jgi:protein phosphatase 1 regulatory subunit 7
MPYVSAGRIECPTVEELRVLELELTAGQGVVVQFSRAPYDADVLERLDALAVRFGALLEIRFYAHYGSTFDCAMLKQLPNVAALSIACDNAVGIEWIATLRALSRSHLEVYAVADGTILRAENVKRVSHLTLGPTRRQVYDLSVLASYSSLTKLTVGGHARNLDQISGLRPLHELRLHSIPRKVSLEFIASLPGLRSLKIVLGGRNGSLDVDAPQLEALEVVRVQGLSDLRPIERFPCLTHLEVQDQQKLAQIAFGESNADLRSIRLHNCKSLRELRGIETLRQLGELEVFRTSIDPVTLRRSRLAPTLHTVAVGTGRSASDRAIQLQRTELGYGGPFEVDSSIAIDWRRKMR